jgi:hypothetical protein
MRGAADGGRVGSAWIEAAEGAQRPPGNGDGVATEAAGDVGAARADNVRRVAQPQIFGAMNLGKAERFWLYVFSALIEGKS